MTKKIVIIILALASFISVDAQTLTKEQLLQDYDYFIQQLEQIHPDPYTAFGGKEAFHRAVRNLRYNLAKRDSLSLDEMKFEGNVLLSTLHDGHTNMGWVEIPETMPDAFVPLRFRVIPDGIIVHGALPEWKSLIGAYVREVGGMPLDSVLTKIDHISTTENRFGQRFFDTDMSFHYATKLSEMYLKKNGITLEQFNRQRGTNLSLGDLSVERKIESFDEFMCADMSILKAQNGQPIYTPKEIYVVTDEHTFSAAFHITYMMWRMGAKVVGVPSSQAPNTFMEVTPFNLPNSGLECSVSNSLQRCFPDNDPRAKVFTPDIQLTYDDYRKYNFSKDAELLYLIEIK
jgi:hypothetical protein